MVLRENRELKEKQAKDTIYVKELEKHLGVDDE